MQNLKFFNKILKINYRKFLSKIEKEKLLKKLTPLQYRVTQQSFTERPFTGKYNDHFEKQGEYRCIVCDIKLFDSQHKYDSSCGWPSFFKGIEQNIKRNEDYSHGMQRIEVQCKNCEAHLGHVFNDGPKPTQQRYCINSASLRYEKNF